MNYKVMLIRKSELVLKTQNLFTKNDLKELHVVGVEHSLSLSCSTQPTRNSFGLLPQGYCKRNTHKSLKDNI